ncbi:DUF2742 domain-containing protein [Mycobacterium servetii]|uniref:DUF2742 domain-containing protein n=1 Tax=Mycobacterium servetii TaxID=3237418 RepID=A0ABV4C1C6_9MYCO
MTVPVTRSQQVSWYETHEFMQALLAQANCGPLPWPGTPSWCELADGDPRKLLSLAAFGVHNALRVETAQAALAEASRAVSAAADWPKISQEVRQRNEFRAEHTWAKRVSS